MEKDMEQLYNTIMKRFCISLLFLFFFTAAAHAQDEILFNADEGFSLNTDRSFHSGTKSYEYTPEQKFQAKSYRDFNPASSQSVSFGKEKTFGNFSIGTKQDSTFSPESYSQTNTYFSKYTKNKFTLNTSYQNKALTSFTEQRRGTFMFTPEYKINDRFSFQNRYSTSLLDRSRQNELVFSVKPFKDDRMNFDIGAGQVYSVETEMPTRSRLNFSTKFRF